MLRVGSRILACNTDPDTSSRYILSRSRRTFRHPCTLIRNRTLSSQLHNLLRRIRRSHNLVDRNSAPLHHNSAPLHRNLAPLHRNLAPLHRNLAPLHHNLAPLHHNLAPLHRNLAPLHRTRHIQLRHSHQHNLRGSSLAPRPTSTRSCLGNLYLVCNRNIHSPRFCT